MDDWIRDDLNDIGKSTDYNEIYPEICKLLADVDLDGD